MDGLNFSDFANAADAEACNRWDDAIADAIADEWPGAADAAPTTGDDLIF